MKDQHTKIKGYRDLTQEEIDLMNAIKTKGIELGELVERVEQHIKLQYSHANATVDMEERTRLAQADPLRWVTIATDEFKQALMALTRSVAQPGFF